MSDGKLLYGRKFDEFDNFGVNFTEQMDGLPSAAVAIAAGGACEAVPHDYNSTLVREYTPPIAALAAFSIIASSTADIQVPNVLKGITTFFTQSTGGGGFSESGTGASEGSYASLSLQIHGTGQSSAALIPSLVPDIKIYWGVNRPVMHYLFYLPSPVTPADVLTRLTALAGTTVSAWPKFEPVNYNFTLIGGHLSVSAQAQVQQHAFISNDDVSVTTSTGGGTNGDISLLVQEKNIPPVLNAAITLSPTSSSVTVEAIAEASMTSGTNWQALDKTKTASVNLSASITPTSIAATSPEAPPTSGLYLHRTRFEPWKWGHAKFICEVFDFADL